MRFGFFDQLPCAAGYSERQRYQDIMAQIELGDALGLDTASPPSPTRSWSWPPPPSARAASAWAPR